MNKHNSFQIFSFGATIFLTIALTTVTLLFIQDSRDRKNAPTRDESISFLHETSLLIEQNQALHTEVAELKTDLLASRSRLEITQKTNETIQTLQMLIGEKDVKGPGIIITISEEIPYYAFIDLINDLYTVGAEAISINTRRLTPKSSFTENPITKQVSISRHPISAPYTIEVIGDMDTMHQILSKPQNILERLKNQIGLEEDISITKQENIILEADI